MLGALDTVAFNRRLRSDWYPSLQNEIRDPGPDQAKWRGSDWVRHAVHHPFLAVPPVLALYPSHAHIDLLPEARGKGVGSRMMHHMMERLAARESEGLHLQVNPKNFDAQAFYRKLGFTVVSSRDLPDDTLFMARRLG